VGGGVLERMLTAIEHRGPDDAGFHLVSLGRGAAQRHARGSEVAAGFEGGFGFARLSIQDLSAAGHQPMVSADGRVVLVFNGEIYNAAAHRTTLSAQGAEFRGHSDTEVILRLYERHGWAGMLERIEGMFAITIADTHSGSVRVARDHFGIKPLYYSQLADGTLLLASEIKGLLACPGFQPELETTHLAEQLMFRYTAWDRTLLRGVKQLPPGHELELRADGSLKQRRFWALADAEPVRRGDAAAEVRAVLNAAVRSQMVSDVPVGTQLSGGIDSSLITLEAAKTAGEMDAFSIIFDDPCISEDKWIGQAAAKAGVRGHRHLFSPQDFVADFERVTWHLDAPPGNPNTLAIHLLAARAKEHVKVMLTGEGCDELFAGYNRFFYTALQQAHPAVFRAGAALCGRSRGRLWRLFGQAQESLERQMVTGSAYGAAALVTELLPDARAESALEQRLEHLAGIPGAGIARQIRYEAETYLPDLLLRQDKMTMAHGIECRVPFLDLSLARLARTLEPRDLACATYGPNARMRGTKRVIKEVARREFGHGFAFRRKRGFDVPLADFFRQPAVRERMQDQWLPGMRRRGLVNEQTVNCLWDGLMSGREMGAGGAEALWVAVGLEVWIELTFGN